MQHNIETLLLIHGEDILQSSGMQQEKQFIQHGSISCYEHSVAVAYMSLWLVHRMKLKADLRSLVRGALLHDYFLYDWHEKDASHRLHGFHHAFRALQNAKRDFAINSREADIIQKHMFPLNPALPLYRESVIVTCADKLCALLEVFSVLLYRLDEARLNKELQGAE